MLIFSCNFLWKNVVSVLHACPSTPALEPVPKFQKNLKQAWQGSGELMKHKEQLMDSGDLPPSAVTLGTQAVGLFSTEGAARPPIPTASSSRAGHCVGGTLVPECCVSRWGWCPPGHSDTPPAVLQEAWALGTFLLLAQRPCAGSVGTDLAR